MSGFKRVRFLAISLFVSCICLCLSAQASYAATNYSDPIVQKALLSGVYRCYTTDKISADAGKLSSFRSFENLVLSTSDSYVALPSGMTEIDDNNVSCSQLFNGYTAVFDIGGRFEGVIELAGKNGSPTGDANKIAFLTGMGYTEVESSDTSDKKCIKFTYNEKVAGVSGNPSLVETDTICAVLDSSGNITELEIEPLGTYKYANVDSALPFFSIVDGKIRLSRAASTTGSHGYTVRTEYDTEKGVGDKWDGDDGLVADLRRVLSSRGDFSYTFSPRGTSITMSYSLPGGTTTDNYDSNATADADYAIQASTTSDPDFVGPGIPKMTTASWKAISYLSNDTYKNYTDLKFSDQEQISLLMASMRATYFNGVDVNEYWVCDVADWNDYGAFTQEGKIHISPDGTVNANCRLNLSKASDATSKKIYHFDSMGFFNSDGSASMFDLAETIAEINRLIGDLPDDTTQIAPSNPGNLDDNNGSAPSCYNEGASLGWILCPVIQAVGLATDGVYDYIEKHWLDITAEEMSSVYDGWTTFRDMANTIFAILLIIVILSQVTGIGLSNYGIKKTLPTLVMVAILVNLSFILCRVAVDITNILGDELRATFANISEKIPGEGASIQSIAAGVLSTLGLVSAVGSGAIAISITGGLQVGSFLIPIIMGFITAIFSIIFFFLILAVRKAGVFVMVILSPVAIVCYALPNTKRFFDRWLRAFSSLLLVYPICGLLMGAGGMLSKILLKTSDGFFSALTAMLIQVAPFFFVPSIVKSSMTALGNIGAKLSAAGSRLGRSASGAFGRSDTAKRIRTSANNWGSTKGRELASRANSRLRNMRGIGRVVRGIEDSSVANKLRNGKIGKFAKANRDRRAAQNWAQYRKQRLDDKDVALVAEHMSEDEITRAEATLERKFQDQLIDDGVNSIITSGEYATASGKEELDHNDVFAVENAYRRLLAEATANPNDSNALLRAKIMLRLLTSKGGPGHELAATYLYDVKDNPNSTAEQLEVARNMARQMMLDTKLMGQYHTNDPGTEQFITDFATGKNSGRTRRDYAKISAGKLKLNTVGDLYRTVYDNLNSLDADSEEYGKIIKTLEKAVLNPRTGASIKDSDVEKINTARRKRYEALEQRWINEHQSALRGLSDAEKHARYLADGNNEYADIEVGIDIPH